MKGHCPLAPTALLLPRPPATASPVAFAPSTQDNEGIRSTKSSFPTFDVRAQFASFLFFCRKNLPFLALRVIKETCFEDLRCHFSVFHLDEEVFFFQFLTVHTVWGAGVPGPYIFCDIFCSVPCARPHQKWILHKRILYYIPHVALFPNKPLSKKLVKKIDSIY